MKRIEKNTIYTILILIALFCSVVLFVHLDGKRIAEVKALYVEMQVLENKKFSSQWEIYAKHGDVEKFVSENYRLCLEQRTAPTTCRANTVFVAEVKYNSAFSRKVLDAIDRQEWSKIKLDETDENRLSSVRNRLNELGI